MGHFADFPREYSVAKSGFLDGILEAHEVIFHKFPATPRNPHYNLSFKDAGKVLNGILLGKKENIPAASDFHRLIVHECARVYQDRLVTNEEKVEFGNELDKIIDNYFHAKWKFEENPHIMFGTIGHEDSTHYVEIPDLEIIQEQLIKVQEEYNTNPENEDLPKMNLVFFREAVEYILKVSRSLILPHSHILNIGPNELGRRSLVL